MSPNVSTPAELANYAVTLVANAACRGHRATLVLSGEKDWCHEGAKHILAAHALPQPIWLGESPPGIDVLHVQSARQLLGHELDGVVIDAWDGFDAEAFGAVAGSLKAGGLMLLLTPPLASWRYYPDPGHGRMAVTPYEADSISGRFLQHIADTLQESSGITLLRQHEALPAISLEAGEVWQPAFVAQGVTPKQVEALAAIEHVAHGHRRRPLVLTSDRGRGKSAVLGIAAAQLLQRGARHIAVTAPRITAVTQLFEHAQIRLPGAEKQRGLLTWEGRRIEFIPPDALAFTPRETELLLVDEAAAIPTSLLERILQHFSRIVFASTIHGYEGNGRGFALRFQKTLSTKCPGWRALHLQQPVRWAEDDPLERLSFRALMLDAEPAPVESIGGVEKARCRFERLEREHLVANRTDLAELFGLLVLAHYRTSPNDLRYLLDGPNVRVYVLRHRQHVVATALVAEEGGLPEALARDVYEGRRRAHGHLMPQSLAVHGGFAEAPTLKAWRVVRIAVHPALMRLGLGRAFLREIESEAQLEGVDYLGASFGADEALLSFWHNSHWLPVRVGLSREAASGTHSVMVIRPNSQAGERLFHRLQTRLGEQLPLLLGESLEEFDADLVIAIFRQLPPPGLSRLNLQDWRDIRSFSETLRGYDVCMPALSRLLPIVLTEVALRTCLDAQEWRLLVQKILQRRDWSTLSKEHGLSGRREIVSAMRKAVGKIVAGFRQSGQFPESLDSDYFPDY